MHRAVVMPVMRMQEPCFLGLESGLAEQTRMRPNRGIVFTVLQVVCASPPLGSL